MFGRKKRREEREAAARAAAAAATAHADAISSTTQQAGPVDGDAVGHERRATAAGSSPQLHTERAQPVDGSSVDMATRRADDPVTPAAPQGVGPDQVTGDPRPEPSTAGELAASLPSPGAETPARAQERAPRWTPDDLARPEPVDAPAWTADAPGVRPDAAHASVEDAASVGDVSRGTTAVGSVVSVGDDRETVAPSLQKAAGAAPALGSDAMSRGTQTDEQDAVSVDPAARPLNRDHSADAGRSSDVAPPAAGTHHSEEDGAPAAGAAPTDAVDETASAVSRGTESTDDGTSSSDAVLQSGGRDDAAVSDEALVSRGTGQVDRQTAGPPGDEHRPRRSGRPQPLSVADMGAAYPWQTDASTPPAKPSGRGSALDAAVDALDATLDGSILHQRGGDPRASHASEPATSAAVGEDRPAASDPAVDAPNGSLETAARNGTPPAMSETADDAARRAEHDDERGTVKDLLDGRATGDATDPHGSVAPLDADEARRAALVDSLPRASVDTPLLAELQLDARRRIELRGRKFPRPERTRVITVANQKGGVGKTTTTVNLAAALAQAGLQVLVLDNDPQGNASTALGIDHRAGTPSIYEVLVDAAPMHEAVQESPDVPGLWCLPATIDLSGAEIELVSMVARETRLRTALDGYLSWRTEQGLEQIDYVFVDCPPSLGLLTVNAFVVAREVLIPIQCEYYALEGLSQLLKTIELIQAHLNPELSVSTILLTMYDARTNLAQQVADEVRTHFPERTLRTTVPRSVRISEAPSYGQTVITYDGGSSGALAYLEAARELAERAVTRATSTDTPAAAPSGPAQEDQ